MSYYSNIFNINSYKMSNEQIRIQKSEINYWLAVSNDQNSNLDGTKEP